MIKTGLIASAAALAVMIGLVLWAGGQLPLGVDIPVHWDAKGKADRYAPRGDAMMMMWIMPLISAAMALLFALGPRFLPLESNLIKSSRAYTAMWIGSMIVMIAATFGVCVSTVQGAAQGAGYNSQWAIRLILAASAGIVILIGNYLPKTRRNWLMGIRTPWTLSSDIAWEKTHRLAGRLFIIAGFLGVLGALIFKGSAVVLIITILVSAAAIISVIYSYFAWRDAPDRKW